MVKLSSNPTCVLSDADVITNEQAERIAKVLTKHLPGADNVTEAGKILGIDANGDVALVEDKTGSTYTAGEGLTLENGEFSVDNPLPGVSGATQGDVLTVGDNGPEWAAVPSELPDSTGASQGDVLTVGSSGLEWATPAGGACNMVKIDPSQTTFAQIAAIMEAGSIPYYYHKELSQTMALMLPNNYENSGFVKSVNFMGTVYGGSTTMAVVSQYCDGTTTPEWGAVVISTITMAPVN